MQEDARVRLERRRDEAQDRALLRVGVGFAILAATAAAAMNMAPGDPGLRGLQHLAIFAQPAKGRDKAPVPPPQPGVDLVAEPDPAPAQEFAARATPSPRMASAPIASDPQVVGSLAQEPVAALTGRVAQTPIGNWRIYEIVGERVLLAAPAGVAWAWAGVDLGQAGVVSRIELAREGVVVVTSRGAIRQRR